MSSAWFDGWAVLLRTLLVGTAAYVALVVLLRASGKRTLAKLNAFDLVVTVALGSTFASLLTSKDVALAQGVVAFALLIGLQFVVTWGSVRWDWLRDAVRSEPTLLLHRGAPLTDAMRRERVTLGELEASARAAGASDLAHVESVVLETDGSLSVVRAAPSAAPSAAGDPTASLTSAAGP